MPVRVLFVALTLGLWAASAQAQETSEEAAPPTELDPATEEARAFFEQGRSLADAHRYAEAAEAFSRSLALVERPSTRFNLAVTLFAQGRHVETVSTLEAYLAGGEEGDADRREAERMLSLARGRVAELSIEVLPANATLVLDGRPWEGTGRRTASVDAGVHVVRVEHPGHAPELLSIEARAGEHVRRAVELRSTQVPSTLRVTSVADAQIQVDGEPHGVGAAQLTLAAGQHTVRVEAPLHAPFERVIEVGWGERHTVFATPAALPDSGPLWDEPAFWAALGGGVGAVAIAVVIGVVASQPPQSSGGSTGVVIEPPRSPAGVVLP